MNVIIVLTKQNSEAKISIKIPEASFGHLSTGEVRDRKGTLLQVLNPGVFPVANSRPI